MRATQVHSWRDWGEGYPVQIEFTAENRTVATLNFEAPWTHFYIEFNTKQRYIGTKDGVTPFSDFKPCQSISFGVAFQIGWDEFQALKRQPNIQYFIVGVNDFNSRLPNAKWQVDIAH